LANTFDSKILHKVFLILQHLSPADFADDADVYGKIYGMMICEKIITASNSLFVAVIKVLFC
ncbi:hypothetical protein ACQ7CU_22265, partial [Chryseobacterium arthrosphaerae]|uniref:hypothetical protein n=1 Tax=Chryseobacterium arthrosphaerae TaxID=651561 RepID=UPI003D335D89